MALCTEQTRLSLAVMAAICAIIDLDPPGRSKVVGQTGDLDRSKADSRGAARRTFSITPSAAAARAAEL
jgi:hypothetical protein